MGYRKAIVSGDLLEIYEYTSNLSPRRASKRQARGTGRRSVARRRDNLARLRKNFIRLVRSNLIGAESPAFFTFTMVEVLRIEQCYRLFTEFVSRFRRHYGERPRYIAVPEFQKRGAVHFHVLFWGFGQEEILNERYTRTIQRLWAAGYVDCIPTDGSPKLAGYLAKYMQKAVFDDRLLSQKAYVCSRNVLRPVSLPFGSAIDRADEIWGIDSLTPLQDKSFGTKWLGRGRYRSYKLNN